MINKISEQQAIDRGMFGPVWHGASKDKWDAIEREGFRIFIGDPGMAGVSNGYGDEPYYDGVPAPIHHLGFGVYFTTIKSIANMFAGGTVRGMKTYYIDTPRVETINFGAPRTMMKWWIDNGFDPDLARKDRVAATVALTDSLKSRYDAVWFKGKGLHRLLDGDQIVVFDTSKIYQIDNSYSRPFDIGTKVRRKADGVIGTIMRREDVTEVLKNYPGAASWLSKDAKWRMVVRWKVGGTDYNVQDIDVDPVPPKHTHIG